VSALSLWQQQALELKVNGFAEERAGFYETERDGKFTILTGTFDPLMSVDRIKGEHGAISCIVLFKNEFCDIEIWPHIELASHVAHPFNTAMTQGRRERQLFQEWRVLCLRITVVGGWIVFGHSTRSIPFCDTPGFEIKFYVIVFLGQYQYRIANLTLGLSCPSSANDGNGRALLCLRRGDSPRGLHMGGHDKIYQHPPPTIFGDVRSFRCLSALHPTKVYPAR
jgi:hypothetical protein